MTTKNTSQRRIIGDLCSLGASDLRKSKGKRGATDTKREGASSLNLSHPARTPMPEALKPPALRTPALTPMPDALRKPASANPASGKFPIVTNRTRNVGTPASPGGAEMGSRRVGRSTSAYVVHLRDVSELSPMASRLHAQGRLEAVVLRIKVLRAEVRRGDNFDSLGDGQLESWWSRLALAHEIPGQVAAIDWARLVSPEERLGLIERTLVMLGEAPRRGGWSVSSGVTR